MKKLVMMNKNFFINFFGSKFYFFKLIFIVCTDKNYFFHLLLQHFQLNYMHLVFAHKREINTIMISIMINNS